MDLASSRATVVAARPGHMHMHSHRAITPPPVCTLRCYISIVVTCASMTVLCHSSAQGICPVDWVFVSELPLPTLSETCSPMRLLPHCFLFVQHNHTVEALSLVCPILATPTHAFVPDTLLDLANLAAPRRSGGLTALTSASTLPFPPCLPRLRPHARLPRHRHKGLPPCMRIHRRLLQP